MMREEIKRRIHEVENELQALKELVDSDAFASKENELTEFEQGLVNFYNKRSAILPDRDGVFNKHDCAELLHESARELLELAKKEICKGCTVSIDSYIKGRDDERKEAEKSYTFHYPTYGPPCPHGGMCANPFKDCIHCPRTGGDIGISTTSGTCKKED